MNLYWLLKWIFCFDLRHVWWWTEVGMNNHFSLSRSELEKKLFLHFIIKESTELFCRIWIKDFWIQQSDRTGADQCYFEFNNFVSANIIYIESSIQTFFFPQSCLVKLTREKREI